MIHDINPTSESIYIKLNRPSKGFKLFLFVVLLITFNKISAQGLIGTPNSLILVYNYPNNHFYVELHGKDKRKTDREDAFIIDNKFIQILAINKKKFIDSTVTNLSTVEVLERYIQWETNYLKQNVPVAINFNAQYLTAKSGREIVFWTYDIKDPKSEMKADGTLTIPSQKQMFAITRAKDYVVGASTALFEANQFEETKAYLLLNISNLIESEKEIELEELNKKVNKTN